MHLHRSNKKKMASLSDWAFAACFLVLIGGAAGCSESFQYLKCPEALFVFGDSFSDPGNVMEAFPFLADAEHPPYGSTFFGSPSGRFSDGRLIIDFLASALGFPFIQPYFKNILPDYRHGVNFAVSGATALNVSDPVPFFLPFQTDQFIRFKKNLIAATGKLQPQDCLRLQTPSVESFGNGLYVVFIGTNDILNGFLEVETPWAVKERIVPDVVKAVSKAIKDLYDEEARNLVVFNVPPLGCMPALLSIASLGPFNSRDDLHCLKEYNGVVQFYNAKLEEALQSLREEIPEATISSVDIYQFMMDVIASPANYGFGERSKLLSTCCGYGGGAYNYDFSVPCGSEQVKACKEPEDYISWDGIHFTEAFSDTFVRELVIKNNYLRPRTYIANPCNFAPFAISPPNISLA
eukprot:Gb_16234 [translate_table: standard]